jgi:hypothetical protein
MHGHILFQMTDIAHQCLLILPNVLPEVQATKSSSHLILVQRTFHEFNDVFLHACVLSNQVCLAYLGC